MQELHNYHWGHQSVLMDDSFSAEEFHASENLDQAVKNPLIPPAVSIKDIATSVTSRQPVGRAFGYPTSQSTGSLPTSFDRVPQIAQQQEITDAATAGAAAVPALYYDRSDDRLSPVCFRFQETKKALPEKWDVLCGRGRGFFEHVGNRRFLSILEPFKDEYQRSIKSDKPKIVKHVFSLIMKPAEDPDGNSPWMKQQQQQDSIRFWRKNTDDNSTTGKQRPKGNKHSKNDRGITGIPVNKQDSCWVELNDREILKKIAHTLREQKSIVRSNAAARSKSPTLMDANTDSILAAASQRISVPALTNDTDQTSKGSEPPSIVSVPASEKATAHGRLTNLTMHYLESHSSFLPSYRLGDDCEYYQDTINMLQEEELPESQLFGNLPWANSDQSPQRRNTGSITGGSSDVAVMLNHPLMSFSEDDCTIFE